MSERAVLTEGSAEHVHIRVDASALFDAVRIARADGVWPKTWPPIRLTTIYGGVQSESQAQVDLNGYLPQFGEGAI